MGNELRGWIVDFDHPQRLETIYCRAPSGLELEFSAFYRRDDICEALDFNGICGFAVPIDLLGSLGRQFSVHDRLGEPLAGGRSVQLPDAADSALGRGSRPLRLFIHIPKTAGTSVRLSLLHARAPGEVIAVYPDHHIGISYENFLSIPAAQRSRFNWIYGHYNFGLHRYLDAPAHYVTFIREPVARLRSNFAHHAAAGTRFIEGGRTLRPSVVINEGLSDEFDNIMTRMIAGVGLDQVPCGQVNAGHVDVAIDHVRQYFSFVGRQDRMTADVATLQAGLGEPVVEPPVANVTPDIWVYDSREIEAVDWKRVIGRNRFDIMLYQRLRESGLTSRLLRG